MVPEKGDDMRGSLLAAWAPRVICAVLPSILWSANAMSAPPLTQIRSFHLDAAPSEVFPLFTASGERAWAPGWDPEILSGAEERASAFRTRNQHGQETVWIVAEYRPLEGRVSYARAALGSNIGLVDVICTASAGGGTDVSVRYTLTGLSESGREFVSKFLDPEQYSKMIDEWRAATADALARSTSMR
jgi:polyketide cyclase/dehydrase/lipid transport protein